MEPQHRMRIHLQIENNFLKRQRNVIKSLMAETLNCNVCRGLIDREAEKKELEFQSSLLRSELETLTAFYAKLDSSKSLFPAAYASSPTYAASVMTSLAVEEVATFSKIVIPSWTRNDKLNIDEYYSRFFPWYARNVPEFAHEASKASAIIACDASSLVAKLMDPAIWHNFFSSSIAEAYIEFEHEEFQTINVTFMPQVSPLTETRNVKLLRCSKHIENDTWIVADISEFFSSYKQDPPPEFMRFPSGYLIQQLANGSSKVTIVDHWVYKKEEQVNDLNPNSGFGGAQRSLAALERQFYNLPLFSNIPMGQASYNNLLNLSRLMVYIFCTGVFGVNRQSWERFGTPVNNIRMFSQKYIGMNGVPSVLVSATGLAKMQASEEVIFGLTKNARKKDIWNYLEAFGDDMREFIRIQRGHNPKNEISVYSTKRTGSRDLCLIQETHYDESGAMIIHACVDYHSLIDAINTGDVSRIALLPCGVTIMKCGQGECVVSAGCQVLASQTMVTNLDEMVNHFEKVVTDSLRNVENVLPVMNHLP